MIAVNVEDGYSDQFGTYRAIHTASIGMKQFNQFLTTANFNTQAEATTVTSLGTTLRELEVEYKNTQDREGGTETFESQQSNFSGFRLGIFRQTKRAVRECIVEYSGHFSVDISLQRGRKIGYALPMRTDYEKTINLKKHKSRDCPTHAFKVLLLENILN